MSANFVFTPAIDCAATDSSSSAPETKQRKSVRRAVPAIDLTLPGILRADDVQAILRVGRTWLYAGIKDGRYPKPDYYEGRLPFWKTSTLLKFIESRGA